MAVVYAARLPPLRDKGMLRPYVEKAVLARLAEFAGTDGGSIRPSHARLAADLEMSERTVRAAIRQLVGRGVLRQTQPASPRTGRAAEYAIDLSRLEALSRPKPATSPEPLAADASPEPLAADAATETITGKRLHDYRQVAPTSPEPLAALPPLDPPRDPLIPLRRRGGGGPGEEGADGAEEIISVDSMPGKVNGGERHRRGHRDCASGPGAPPPKGTFDPSDIEAIAKRDPEMAAAFAQESARQGARR